MLVSANTGVIWAIFIIISIVAQVIKARKKGADQAPGEATSQREEGRQSTTNDNELRQFLESLSDGNPRPEPTSPPITQRQELRHMSRPTPQPITKTPKRSEPPPAPTTQPAQSPKISIIPEVKLEPVVTPKPSGLQLLICKELQKTDATRKAIVLREILGPPIALKQPEKALV